MANNTQLNPGALGDAICDLDLSIAWPGYPSTGKLPLGAIYVGATTGAAPTPVCDANPFPTVIIVSGAAVDPRSIRALTAADVVTEVNSAAILADVAKIPALGQALPAASVPVVLTVSQLATLTPTTGLALDATLTGGNQQVQGNVASGVADAGNPLKLGGLASSSAPAAVTAGQRVNTWLGLNGGLVLQVSQGAVADAMGAGVWTNTGGTAVTIGVAGTEYNGATWDRQRNNTDLSLLVSAARTATVASADQTNYNGRGVRVTLNVTAASGTGGLTVEIQGKDSISASYYQLNTNPTAVIATGTYVYDLYPTTLAAAANGITQITEALLSRTWRVNVAVGDASSYTYSISGITIL